MRATRVALMSAGVLAFSGSATAKQFGYAGKSCAGCHSGTKSPDPAAPTTPVLEVAPGSVLDGPASRGVELTVRSQIGPTRWGGSQSGERPGSSTRGLCVRRPSRTIDPVILSPRGR